MLIIYLYSFLLHRTIYRFYHTNDDTLRKREDIQYPILHRSSPQKLFSDYHIPWVTHYFFMVASIVPVITYASNN